MAMWVLGLGLVAALGLAADDAAAKKGKRFGIEAEVLDRKSVV
jgi:hypothetical protein